MNKTFTDKPSNLPPLLEEFRTALQDEIEVAKRNSSNSAVPLSNGHKVSSMGNAHQYSFLIDSVLNMPDGAPGDLIVPGKTPLAATIVSAEGLNIVISVEADLGKFVPAARLQTNLTILMRKLIERIENNANQQNPAAQRMLGQALVEGFPENLRSIPLLNKHQMNALKSALGRNLTVIWGPPGTGKTHTIGTIAEHLNNHTRTVLLVSHTNTAVDQAIKHVAKALVSQLADGTVIRVGEVRDKELSERFPEVLLKTQVERQSRELVEERENLVSQKRKLAEEMAAAQKAIEIIKWLGTAQEEITTIEGAILARDRSRQYEREATTELNVLRQQHSQLLEIHEIATKALQLRKLIDGKQQEYSNIQHQIKSNSEGRTLLSARIAEQVSRLQIAMRLGPMRKMRSALPSQSEQKSTIAVLSEKLEETKDRLTVAKNESYSAKSLLDETESAGILGRMLKRLPKPENQRATVRSLAKQVVELDVEIVATQQAHGAATGKLAKIIEMDGELARYADIGTHSQELEVKIQLERRLEQISVKIRQMDIIYSRLKVEVGHLQDEFSEVAGNIDGDIKAVYLDVCAKLKKLKDLQNAVRHASQKALEMQLKAESLFWNLLTTIKQWAGSVDIPKSLEEGITTFREWHSRLAVEYALTDMGLLNHRITEFRIAIRTIESKISEVDAKLAEVERQVINKAAILGATLTKTYLSEDIQSRRFDTVILDEASMAPIPALWSAALLAEKNIIIVGDFKQLPPIVLSKNDLTRKWLGRDVFEASGIKDKWAKGETPPYFVPLLEQRRMLPEISKVANLFYDKLLVNAFTTPEQYSDYDGFTAWYENNLKYDSPIVLVDTGPVNAWVTSVVKNGSSSRLNFLSATIAVDIAEQLFSIERPERKEGAPKRVLIVAPYRAHAKLVTILLKDFVNLQDEVVAGTAHSFQGSEADVVIFDMVVDEPHFRVNLFMPSLDEELKCLLNVALTRAKFRLFILGDFDYCKKQGRKAFLGKTLIPYLLEQFPRVDARDIVPEGLAARAAKAQMSVLGGQIDPNSERIVVTQEDFYRLLASDLAASKSRIIIYSPFVTTDRVSFLLPQLQAAIERNVEVYIITKALSERSKSDLSTIKKIESQLADIGIAVTHKLRMHEKLVFVDDDVTWSGSLNPLSFSNTREIMERRKSKAVLKDYFQILRLNELLAAHGKPEGKCPICGKEMIAAEGADQPYYWRCVNDECFTRGVDQPYPFEGVLSCGNCNSFVEYGYWGDYPHWRCTSNKKHRQKIFKSHLRLPKMAALVPHGERKKLCKILMITSLDEYIWGSDLNRSTKPEQLSLF